MITGPWAGAEKPHDFGSNVAMAVILFDDHTWVSVSIEGPIEPGHEVPY